MSPLKPKHVPTLLYNSPTVLQVPNCAVHGICSTGSAFDVVRIHTTKSFML